MCRQNPQKSTGKDFISRVNLEQEKERTMKKMSSTKGKFLAYYSDFWDISHGFSHWFFVIFRAVFKFFKVCVFAHACVCVCIVNMCMCVYACAHEFRCPWRSEVSDPRNWSCRQL